MTMALIEEHGICLSDDVVVHTALHGTVCLVCPVVYASNKGLRWIHDMWEKPLFRDDTNVGGNNLSLEVNSERCHSNNYSIKIANIVPGGGDGSVTCENKGKLVTKFRIFVAIGKC